MHAVVNHLQIRPDADWTALSAKVDAFNNFIGHPDFRGCNMIRASDQEAILVILFRTRDALDDVSRNDAGPWFAENVRPFLAGPVSRAAGEIVAGAMGSEV
ncbi:hypothetical protein [Mesorhizobium sp. CO1-1-8]|uniref:hypothetical protein n=1 Tax=Mesorhizobium sp. CO1-1-8 TaxID=2876631 RepID=UPI001CD07211|nr:hypothetical protein [Mesorhizobium sp. CO1-1-8]MBZ9775021.1 hypothetical protein [Mesorhizobium sp. CO1-1-8]